LSSYFRYLRIPVVQFFAGFFGGKGPVDFGGSRISLSLPTQGFMFKGLLSTNAAVKALPGEGGKLNFIHVEPGTVLGRVVKFELVAQLTGCFQG
jgi:hypothetical protein